MINEGNVYVIIDCDKPSYIRSNHEVVLLKNHIINDSLMRKKHPNYNDTDAYICDKKENVWRVSPEMFKKTGYIGFDEKRAAEADSNFIIFADEKQIKEYLNNQEPKFIRNVQELALKIIHHPKYFKANKVSKKKPAKEVDIFNEQDKKLPKWFVELRKNEMNKLFGKIAASSDNFTIENDATMKEYFFGNGYSFVLFDCQNPSYLFPKAGLNKF